MNNVVRQIRDGYGWTQQELADKLGCTVMTVKRAEKDGTVPRNAAILRNLRALATPLTIEVPEPEPTARQTGRSASKARYTLAELEAPLLRALDEVYGCSEGQKAENCRRVVARLQSALGSDTSG